jgi:hypothetical protein
MLVTQADLINYMDIKLTLRQQDAAEMILAGLQSEMEAYLRRPVEVEEFEEKHVVESMFHGVPMGTFLSAPPHSYTDSFVQSNMVNNTTWATPPSTIYLRNSPVVAVESVTVKSVNGQLRTLVVDDDYVVRRFGIDYFYALDGDIITVNYTAGLDGTNIPMFKLLILRAASREMQNMHDDVVGIKDITTRNVGPLVTGFLDTELASLRKYRRSRVA